MTTIGSIIPLQFFKVIPLKGGIFYLDPTGSELLLAYLCSLKKSLDIREICERKLLTDSSDFYEKK